LNSNTALAEQLCIDITWHINKTLSEYLLCPTGRVRGSQPARRSRRSVKKRMNNNIDVM
jgi:hypothetical protein